MEIVYLKLGGGRTSVYLKKIHTRGNIPTIKSGVNMQRHLHGRMFHYLCRRMHMNGDICQECI